MYGLIGGGAEEREGEERKSKGRLRRMGRERGRGERWVGKSGNIVIFCLDGRWDGWICVWICESLSLGMFEGSYPSIDLG